MKKLLFTFILTLGLTFGLASAQTGFDPFGSIGDGFGDVGQAGNNFFEGIGEDIITDIFGNTGVGPIPDGDFTLPCPEEFNIIGENTSARGFILNVLNFFLSFLGIISVAMLIYAGFLYVTDAGEGGNQEKAKKTILYAVIGILLVLASFAIVNTVIQNAGSGGADSQSETNISSFGGFSNGQSLVDQCAQNGSGTFQQTVIKWQEFSGDGFVTDYGNGILVKNGEPVTYSIEISPEIVNAAGEAESISVQSTLWNFGGGFVSYPGDHPTETNTYFEDGEHLVGVIVIDTKNRKYLLTKKVLVGDGVDVRISASDFFPESGKNVALDGTRSTTRIGTIQEYEWSAERISSADSGTCPTLSAARPKINAEFFKNPNGTDDLVCDVTLTVQTNIPGVSGSHTETITVGDGNASPKPIVSTILVEQDPNETEEDHLFRVRTWVDDKIDFPLENFRFEAWESGKLLKTQSTTFGMDPATISTGGSTPPSQGYSQTYSEIILDLSEFGGTRDIIFRVIATNSYGNQGQKDAQQNEYTITGGLNVPQKVLDFTLPANIQVGKNHVPTLTPDELLLPNIYEFEWFIDGVSESTMRNPTLSFPETGMHTVELVVSVKPDKEETFTPQYGWKVTKNIFVQGASQDNLEQKAIDFSLPPQIAPGETYATTVSPNTLLDPEIYDFSWEIDGIQISTEKNPEILFQNNGLNAVSFIVSVKSGMVPNFTPTNGWKVTKNIFVGEQDPNAPYKRLDFSTSSPIALGTTYTPFVSPNELLDSELYSFDWTINGQPESSEKEPALLFETPGTNTIAFRVSLKPGKKANFTPVDGWTVSKTVFVQDTSNHPPIIYNISVAPGNTGNTATIFSFYPLVNDPDGDALTYAWDFGDDITMSAKNVAHRFQKPGTYSATLSVSDGLATTEEFVTFTIVNVGDEIPPSTIDVYVRDEESDLESGDIGIQNKEVLKDQVNELYDEESQIEEEIAEKQAEKERLEEALKNETDPEKKEALRIEIFQLDESIKKSQEKLETVREKINELETLLDGEYIIQGTTDTKFFIYGTVPAESARAVFLEWESGDDRTFLGQNISLKYEKPGIYNVKMIVSDGESTVFDTIGIKVNKKRPSVSQE